MIKDKRWVELPISELVAASWNYKIDDETKSKKLVENIKRNGQVENILVRLLETGFYEVVNGNHRLTAFQTIGLKKVVCFDLGKISDSAAQRIAIETNETRFYPDNMKLAGIIKDLIGDGFTLDDLEITMPFDMHELQAFGEFIEWEPADEDNDAEKEWEGMPEFDAEPKSIKTIILHFATEKDISDFEKLFGQRITDTTKYIWFPPRPRIKARDLAFVNES